MKRLISISARKELSQLLPNLDGFKCKCKREDHWNLFRTLAFNHYIDKDTGAVRLGAETIARAVNQLQAYKTGHFNAGKIIKHFLQDVIPGCASLMVDNIGREWSTSTWVKRDDDSSYKISEGKQRRVLLNWPLDVKTIIDNELNGLYNEEKVYIESGNKRNLNKERNFLNLKIEECQQEVEVLECLPAKDIATYLNNLPVNGFNKIKDNYKAALEEIKKISNHNVKNQQLIILDTISESPKPVYKPTENTDRLFGNGANITNLKKNIRKILTRGWTEADLRSAQLAIVARLWNIKGIDSFVKKSPWDSLIIATGLTKSMVKDYTYGAIFGMSLKRIKDEAGVKFFNHPLIQALLKARQSYISKVVKDGYLLDAFGTSLEVTKDNVLSIIARQAQSYEMALIDPIFKLAATTEDFTVQLYQFDGVSLKFHNENTKSLWISKIVSAVDEVAKNLGIDTELVVEDNNEETFVELVKEVYETMISPVNSVNITTINECFSSVSKSLFLGAV